MLFILLLLSHLFIPLSETTSYIPQSTDAYLNNGLSGLYKWEETMEVPLPTRDTYYRWQWRTLEPTLGVYNFSVIDAKLADAKDTFNGKFGFRVIVADSFFGGRSVPDYFATSANGWTCTVLSNTYIPNWNGAYLLSRITALFGVLSARYSNDRRLGWVDVGIYGNYGEWHNAQFYGSNCFPGPNGWGEATLATKQAFIDLVTSSFPNTFVVINTNDYDGLCIALSGTRLGIRTDTLSDATWTSSLGTDDPFFNLQRLQYRAAPFISEMSTNPDFQFLRSNAQELHVTTTSNGNFPIVSSSDQDLILASAPFIGPHIKLTNANWANPVPSCGCFSISLTFVNNGTSRTYDPWQTIIQFRSLSTGNVVWQSSSVTDIRNVLPVDDKVPSWTGTNNFQLPCTIVPDTYSVVLLIKDPTNYRPNFLLAIVNVNGDLSYTLGTISISTSTPNNPNCSTSIPTYTQPKYPIGPGVNSWNSHPIGPLYTDFLFWGWTQSFNGATGTTTNTSPVYGSSGYSIAFTSTNPWGLWQAQHICGINRTGYNYIHFRMRAATPTSGSTFFYVYQSPWNNPPSVNLANYGGDPISTNWMNYNIPFSAFAGLPIKFDYIVFGASNNGATFYIDDISFTDTIIN